MQIQLERKRMSRKMLPCFQIVRKFFQRAASIECTKKIQVPMSYKINMVNLITHYRYLELTKERDNKSAIRYEKI